MEGPALGEDRMTPEERRSADPILYAHLRDDLKPISEPFGILAMALVNLIPRNAERTVSLRKLLEAKDAAVRAKVMKP
jgi:hypothetical protein